MTGDVRIINLTPHPITLIKVDGSKVDVPSSGVVRVMDTAKQIGTLDGIKLIKKSFSKVSDDDIKKIKDFLKDKNTIVIVSLQTAMSLRDDDRLSNEEKERIFIISNTVRDSNGRIIGAEGIINIPNL